ncbi:hypothetical protein PIB30_109767, partial [Stylosanthes scabra]|nr:hypothetical protein [Stylosanthes scabra]
MAQEHIQVEGFGDGEWQRVNRRKPRFGTQPGHKQVWNGYGGRYSWRKKDFKAMENRLVTIFIDNLPKSTTIDWLWTVFGLEGKIADVYLSKKVRPKNPLPFAFVRFEDCEAAHRAIDRRNGWVVWGCKLRVSEAKYKRNQLRKDKEVNEHKKEDTTERHTVTGLDKKKNTRVIGMKSYKEAVTGSEGSLEVVNMRDDNAMFDLGGSKIELMACEETKKKLEKSVVGETLNPFIFNELKEAVKRDWDSIVEIKKMGDTKILLTFDTEENLS